MKTLTIMVMLILFGCGKAEDAAKVDSTISTTTDGTVYSDIPGQNYYIAWKRIDNVTEASMSCRNQDLPLGDGACNCFHAQGVISATIRHYFEGNKLICACDSETVQVVLTNYCAK
jgi:hypothetical protein